VASNPEFLREGCAIPDFMQPDRVVIGTSSHRARAILQKLYAPLAARGTPILFTGLETAELTKYAANTFLAIKISFINEIADLCERIGADALDISRGIGLDHRIGKEFLQPGPGFGGSCFPKDTLALMRTAQDASTPLRLTETAVYVNDARKASMGARVIRDCGGSVRGQTIAVLGLAFKPDTDDMRDAPSVSLIHRLVEEGASIKAYDPVAMKQAQPLLPRRVQYCPNWGSAVREADAVLIVTEWAEFRTIEPATLRKLMRGSTVIDLRNIFEPTAMSGLHYYPVGRPGTGSVRPPEVLLSQVLEEVD
jgi:UDPglucose 6-dehydrogenase